MNLLTLNRLRVQQRPEQSDSGSALGWILKVKCRLVKSNIYFSVKWFL